MKLRWTCKMWLSRINFSKVVLLAQRVNLISLKTLCKKISIFCIESILFILLLVLHPSDTFDWFAVCRTSLAFAVFDGSLQASISSISSFQVWLPWDFQRCEIQTGRLLRTCSLFSCNALIQLIELGMFYLCSIDSIDLVGVIMFQTPVFS